MIDEPHCVTCTCVREMDHWGIGPPNEKQHGRCPTCGVVRWSTTRSIEGRGEPIYSMHCGCCTHLHNLPAGGHDNRCFLDPPQCILLNDD